MLSSFYHMTNQHEHFMKEALIEAQKAYELGEVPIGAVVVLHGNIIARAHNKREQNQMATAHAELLAIQLANDVLKQWRLEDCTLYVTLEPCPMCSGAIIMSRLKEIVYGAKDEKAGTCGTLMNLVTDSRFNHQANVVSGVLERDCQQLLQSFFKQLRQRNKQFNVKLGKGKQLDKAIQQLLVTLSRQTNASRLKHYEKTAMQTPYFGVMMKDIHALASQYKKQTTIGIGLWHSLYLEARLLATKIIDPNALNEEEVLWMSESVFRPLIAQEWVDKIVSKRKDAIKWEKHFENGQSLLFRLMYWRLLYQRVNSKQMVNGEIDDLLTAIAQNMLSWESSIQWQANSVLVEIGVRYDTYRKRCIAIGETLALYKDDVVAKGCTRAYAPEWIVAKVNLLESRKK